MKSCNINEVKTALKRDIVTTRLLFDPIAIPLVCFLSRFPAIQPNHLTIAAFFFGVLAAAFFALGYTLAGAGMYYMFFLCDRMDGTLARAMRCFHPLGKFYDFVVDRNTVWLISMGIAFSFWKKDLILIAGLYLIYLSLFLLKDVWAYEISLASFDSADKGVIQKTGKTHFKPGQVLSCHLAFLFAPISGYYYLFVGGAILCVLFSVAVNGLLPLVRLFCAHGVVLLQENDDMENDNE